MEQLHAYCGICRAGIYAPRTDDVHCLYRDELPYVGEPICDGCFGLLEPTASDRLDCLKKKYSALYSGQELRKMEELKIRFKTGQISIEKWL